MRPTLRTLAAVVFSITFGLYLATNYDGVFALDDIYILGRNPAVTQFDPASLSSWKRLFFDSPPQVRPIPLASFGLQWHFWKDRVFAYHVLSDLLPGIA